MPKAQPMTHTEDLYQRAGTTLGDACEQAAAAVAGGDFVWAVTAGQHLTRYAEHLQVAVVRDALAAGVDWWRLGEDLGLHPQAAFERYRCVAEGLRAPAQQRRHLAVVCTAGLLAEHEQSAEHGIDADELGDDHSLTQDLSVLRLRQAAAALDEDLWISVRLPGGYEGADDLDDGVALERWTTVVAHPDELGWLREALQLHTQSVTEADDEGEDW